MCIHGRYIFALSWSVDMAVYLYKGILKLSINIHHLRCSVFCGLMWLACQLSRILSLHPRKFEEVGRARAARIGFTASLMVLSTSSLTFW